MSSADKSLLFDVPFKEYALIAENNTSIDVHKCILYLESKYFKNILTDVNFNKELFTRTDFYYEDLMDVVKWMYGLEIELNANIYEIADKFIITRLLSIHWNKYMKIDNEYLTTFSSIIIGELDLNLVEDRYYDEIYDAVVYYIATKEYGDDNDILYKLDISLLESWFSSKYRLHTEEELINFIIGYEQIYPSKHELIKERLFPHINFNLVRLPYGAPMKVYLEYGGDKDKYRSDGVIKSLLRHPAPFFYMLYRLIYKRGSTRVFLIHRRTIQEILNKGYDDNKSLLVSYPGEDFTVTLGELVPTKEEYDDIINFASIFMSKKLYDRVR